jgi:anti-sigma B factor antagonist
MLVVPERWMDEIQTGEVRTMTIRKRAVAVIQLPEIRNAKERQAFLRDLQNRVDSDRPFVVLDCSSVGQLDRPGIHLLLCCLEEAMKRNGDLKLAGLDSSAKAILKTFGVYRLFDIHDTTAGAVNSFYNLPTGLSSQTSSSMNRCPQPESAA